VADKSLRYAAVPAELRDMFRHSDPVSRLDLAPRELKEAAGKPFSLG